MITKELEILYLFAKEPWKKYTFTELQKVSKKKSKSYLELTLKKFIENNILKRELIGHLPVYSLNNQSSKARGFAGFAIEYFSWNKKHIPYDDLQRIINKIPTPSYILLITGSYASEKQTENSDMDIVIIIDDSAEPKRIYASLVHACELNIPPIHLYVFKNKEFIEMLCNEEWNYGKEIAKNNLILTGGGVYLKLVEEAIKNGFNNR